MAEMAGLVVVALSGPTAATGLLRARVEGASLLIAADAGALRLSELGLEPDVLTGDFDSLPSRRRHMAAAAGTEIVPHPAPQQITDGAAALRLAVERGAESIVVLGSHGGERLDHSLGNLLALVDPALSSIPITAIDGWNEAVPLRAAGRARVTFHGAPGDYVSLLPLSDDARITTHALRWPLGNDLLQRGASRGLSNELTEGSGGFELLDGEGLATHTIRDLNGFDAAWPAPA